MRLTINGEQTDIPADGALSIRGLLERLDYAPARDAGGGVRVAVELNGAVVPRAEHARAEVGDGDVLEIVTLVGGG